MVAAPPEWNAQTSTKREFKWKENAQRLQDPETPFPERCGAFANGPQLTLRPFVDSSSLGCVGIVFQLTGHGKQ